MLVVPVGLLKQGEPEFLHGGEGAHPEYLLLEGANEALGAAIVFGTADKVVALKGSWRHWLESLSMGSDSLLRLPAST